VPVLSTFYSIIIPIENLRRILSKKELQKVLTERSYKGKVWFDDYLYREGSMSPIDNEYIIKFWEDKGLVPIEIKNGKKYWKDLCLIAFPDDKATLPCSWIEVFDVDNNIYINYKGKSRENLVKEHELLEKFNENYIKKIRKHFKKYFISEMLIVLGLGSVIYNIFNLNYQIFFIIGAWLITIGILMIKDKNELCK